MNSTEFWQRVYIASIAAGRWNETAKDCADEAALDFEKRCEQTFSKRLPR